MLNKKYALNSDSALNREGLDIEDGVMVPLHMTAIRGAKVAMEEYTMESVIQGHHIYNNIWHPILEEQLTLEREDENSHNRHTVCAMKSDTIVGHVPTRALPCIYWYFIRHGGMISCEVTGSRKRGIRLEVPCVYETVGSKKLIQRMKGLTSAKKLLYI